MLAVASEEVKQVNTYMSAVDWEVYRRDRCKCQYCGLDGWGNFDVWMNLAIEHIISRKPGAEDNTADNKVVACHACNISKGNYPPKGNNREERIADIRRHIQERRAEWRRKLDKMMPEYGK
jgi:5-methylcytosine-specific restriction endonuclease McrA